MNTDLKTELMKPTKPANVKPQPALKLEVGKVIRLPGGTRCGHSIWMITGLHHGALGCEALATIRRLDMNAGSAYGETQEESVVPLVMLETHSKLENC